MKVKVSRLNPNPYRDMEMYPISAAKVKSLVESINQTDFWDNLLARVKNNTYKDMTGQDLIDFLKETTTAPDDMRIELAYGHHRLAAVVECGIEEIDIPVKVIEDEVMLKIMANENKGDWASNMSVILETVRQVRGTIHKTVSGYESFEDYAEENSFFKTQKTWAAARDISNIGYRRIHEFLGETWSESDIRFADMTLKAVDDGTIEQAQVVHMPSIGVMRQYINIAKAIREQTWPQYFKDLFVQRASEYICSEGTTVKIATRCATMVKKGNLPLSYLEKQKVVPFDLVKELKKVCEGTYDKSDKPKTMEPDELMNVEGIGDYDDIDESIETLKAQIKKAEERREAAGGAPEEEGAERSAEGEDTVSSDAQDAIAAAEADAAAVAEPTFPDNIEVPGEGSDARERVDMIIQTAAGVNYQISQLRGEVANVLDGDDNLSEAFRTAFDMLFGSVTQLGLEAYGRQYLQEALEDAEESM